MGWYLFGYPIALAIGHAEAAPYVSHGSFGSQSTESDYLGDILLSVFPLHVFKHLMAVVDAEVGIDIRHGLSARVEKSLKNEVVFERIYFGYIQTVTGKAPGGAPSAWSDRDAVFLGISYIVPDDEEVGVEAHLVDDAQFIVEPLPHFLGYLAVFLSDPLLAELPEVVFFGHSVGKWEYGQVIIVEYDFDIAAVSDLLCVFNSFRYIGEQFRHLIRGLDIKLVIGELHPLGIVPGGDGLDA